MRITKLARKKWQFVFNYIHSCYTRLKTEGYNKSKEAKAFQQRYYPNDYAGQMPVIEDKTTEEFYKAYNGFTDDYDEKRYKSITDDMYTKGISGYIEKVN